MIALDWEYVADRLIAEAREAVGDAWDDLEATGATDEIVSAAADLAQLLARAALGANLDREIVHTKARLANWTWVASDVVRARWAQWLEEAVEVSADLLAAAVRGALR